MNPEAPNPRPDTPARSAVTQWEEQISAARLDAAEGGKALIRTLLSKWEDVTISTGEGRLVRLKAIDVPASLIEPGLIAPDRPGGRDWGARCGLCRRRIGRRSSPGGPVPCGRCGDVAHKRCYWRTASHVERFTLECTEQGYVFLCARCRS